ncbi:MAG TPA: hypothetical protein VM099_09710 [Gemmatimonadaceae bacterium]|nr:hypothetical protein [Gemmatimonadaceae bacterium]
MRFPTVLFLVSLITLPSVISAQQASALHNGAKIEVTDRSGHRNTGILQSLSSDSLYQFAGKDGRVSVLPVSSLTLIRVSRGRNHAVGAIKYGLIGTAVGALGLGALGAVLHKDGPGSMSQGDDVGIGAFLGGIGGLTIGTVVGAAVGTEKWERVYVAEH